MQLKMMFPLATLTFLATLAHGQSATDKNRNAIYISPVTMIVNSGLLEYPVISIAYERCLSEAGVSVFIPFHAAYTEDPDETDVAYGSGLGFRKYFGHAFSGSFLTVQSDYIKSYTRKNENSYGYDANNNWVLLSSSPTVKNDFLSTTQLSIGYKWAWRQFTMDLGGGGAFYAQDTEKRTNLVASANVGFPFSAETFGL